MASMLMRCNVGPDRRCRIKWHISRSCRYHLGRGSRLYRNLVGGQGRKSPQQSDDAQRVYLEDKFATREEVAEIKQQHRAEVSDLHARLTGITVKLNEMYGQQNMMIEILKSRKSL